MKRLSIITINLNNSIGLEKTLRSVLIQKFTDYEYIVIDGGSNDGSIDVIGKFEQIINHWVSEKDSGIFNAMNKGIRVAKAEYLLFLNSGDYFINENVLEECFKFEFNKDLIYGNQFIELNGKIIPDRSLEAENISFMTLKNDFIPHQCTFIKRDLFEKVGFYNEENRIISDWEFLMKSLFMYNCSIKQIPINMVVYDAHGISSIETHKKQQNIDRCSFIKNNFPLILKDIDDFERLINKPYIKFIFKIRRYYNKFLMALSFRRF